MGRQQDCGSEGSIMLIDLTQEEIDLILTSLEYLDYLGYSCSPEEEVLLASITEKLGDE